MAVAIQRLWHRKGSGPRPPDYADVFYIGELEIQCEYALRAFGEMQQAYGKDQKHPSLLPLAHVLLVFAGNVAKVLTAPKQASPKARARAKRLRETLGLADVSFEDVRVARNFFEHFDERIDRYLEKHKGFLGSRFVLDHFPAEVQLDDGRTFKPSYLQFLNTASLELTLYDQQFRLSDILRKIEAVHKAAHAWLAERTETQRETAP
jgi:hypothetical protein